jgi:hypothetical protein
VVAYLKAEEFADYSAMPASDIDALETAAPGWLARQLEIESARIDARLRKRYDVPFQLPAPATVCGWLAKIVTVRAYLKRGVDSNDMAFEELKAESIEAVKEIAEAAEAVGGLFDLPLINGNSAIRAPSTRVYSESSPYAGFDGQRDTAWNEDRNRGGTYR